MKTLLMALLAIAIAGCGDKALREAFETDASARPVAPLTEPEVEAAIRDALSRGAAKAAVTASARGGFLDDPRLQIAYPPEMAEIDEALRRIGRGGDIDEFVRLLNRDAAAAAARAKPLLIKSITRMPIDDAFEILEGDPDAATRYMIEEIGDELEEQYRRLMRSQLASGGTQARFDDIVGRYNESTFLFDVEIDLAAYAAREGMKGLYLLVADEEALIRSDPAARTTRLLRRVFGSLY